ncbi:hypothetical protein L1987_47755 [Smallanthus sonchifolius]|uniref:Uncharacterized protein n=1 Tax=Smallanthus sonchifolius TaxID=185202 RepID=A0ACB9FR71_9ASTR|nr:hypothetical protein L1987_47755 [Smallanthus sonchifolius]
MIRFGITSGVELNLEGRTDCKLGLAWCNAQGDKWLVDWSTYNDPARMLWCLLGHGEKLMELALNLYFWTWIESPHHHIKDVSISSSPSPAPPPPTTFTLRSTRFAGIAYPLVVSSISSLFIRVLMPRKKEPPPSSLPPRQSTRGVSKSTSLIDEEEAETPKVPLVGLGDYQEDSAGSLRPPSLLSGSKVCHINKENSFVPSVTASLDESEQGLGSINKDIFLENCDAAGILPAGKTGLAGMSDSDGPPGVLGSFHRDGQEKTSSAVAGSLVARKPDPAGELCLDGNIAAGYGDDKA